MTKATGGWPILSPQQRHAWANRDALADVARQLSANALQMWGHVNGGDLLAENTPAPAGMASPGTGTLGHDHSGGLWGRPLYRDVATLTGDDGANLGNIETNSSPWVAVVATLIGYGEEHTHFADFAIWVPGCQGGREVGAYNALAWNCKVRIVSTTNVVAADVLEVTLTNTHPDRIGTRRLEVSNPASAGTFRLDALDDDRLPVAPGAWNRIRLGLDFQGSGTTGSPGPNRSITALVEDLQIGVFADLCT